MLPYAHGGTRNRGHITGVQQGNENTSSILPAPVSNFSDRNGYDSVRADAMALEAYMSSNTDTSENPTIIQPMLRNGRAIPIMKGVTKLQSASSPSATG